MKHTYPTKRRASAGAGKAGDVPLLFSNFRPCWSGIHLIWKLFYNSMSRSGYFYLAGLSYPGNALYTSMFKWLQTAS